MFSVVSVPSVVKRAEGERVKNAIPLLAPAWAEALVLAGDAEGEL